MNHKRDGLLLPERDAPQIDETLDAKLAKSLGMSRETYSDLEVEAVKKLQIVDAWHNGRDHELLADHQDVGPFLDRKERLEMLRIELHDDQSIDVDLKDAYVRKIDEEIAKAVMVIASSTGDMELFREANESVYGKPDEDVYRAALDWIVHDAERLLETHSDRPTVVAAAQRVINLLGEQRGYREILAPEERVFEAVRQDHMRPMGYYGLLLSGVTVPEGKISNEVGDPILQTVLKNIGSNYAISDADGASWSVAHSEEAVKRPGVYNMPRNRFIGLGAGHEIGSHLLERLNGERSPLKILVRGMDRYELGNEGRAVIREQVPYETFDEFGKLVRWRDILRRHIAISYATGVGEDSSHSSSEVYQLINTIDTMYQTKLTPDDLDAATQKAQQKTDTLLLRVLKGTDGTSGAFLKDIVYLEGNIASWVTAAESPEAISDGDMGKHDINNPNHVRLLRKVGVLQHDVTKTDEL